MASKARLFFRPSRRFFVAALATFVLVSSLSPTQAVLAVDHLEIVSIADDGLPRAESIASASVSGDGNRILLTTDAELTNELDNAPGFPDLYLYDRSAGTTTLINASTEGGTSDFGIETAVISADGNFVAYSSASTDLITGLTISSGSFSNVFLYDVAAGATTLVSHATPDSTANGSSFAPDINSDGRFITFHSDATDLVDGVTDTNSLNDVFLYDRVLDSIGLVSHVPGSPLVAANELSDQPAISPDGDWISFRTSATDLAPELTSTSPLNVVL